MPHVCLQMALQSMHRHGLPTLSESSGRRPFSSAQQQPRQRRAAACPCSAAHGQQHQQPSLDRRQLLAAAATLASARLLPAAAYQPPPLGTAWHACMRACAPHALRISVSHYNPTADRNPLQRVLAGKRRNDDVLDGYAFLYPEDWSPVTVRRQPVDRCLDVSRHQGNARCIFMTDI